MFNAIKQFLQSIFQTAAINENHMKQLRLRRGLTIRQVMKYTGYSMSMIHKIEEGEKMPSPDKAYLLRQLYRTTFDKIYLPYFE